MCMHIYIYIYIYIYKPFAGNLQEVAPWEGPASGGSEPEPTPPNPEP